ncbi:MAG: HIT domain-containing protein [bacterium]|nr:HIT domain-containing protein [bacterium]
MKENKRKFINFVNIGEARLPEQKSVMEQIIKDGVCPFCPENLRRYHKEPTLREGKYWLLSKNQWPYEHTNAHFIAIHKEHIEHIKDLAPEAGAELVVLFAWAAREYNIPGGAVAIRFGESEHGNYGSSVLHLHAHLIQPDLENPQGEKIKFKIGQPIAKN